MYLSWSQAFCQGGKTSEFSALLVFTIKQMVQREWQRYESGKVHMYMYWGREEAVLPTVAVSQVTAYLSIHRNIQQSSHGNTIQTDINVKWVITPCVHSEQSGA